MKYAIELYYDAETEQNGCHIMPWLLWLKMKQKHSLRQVTRFYADLKSSVESLHRLVW